MTAKLMIAKALEDGTYLDKADTYFSSFTTACGTAAVAITLSALETSFFTIGFSYYTS